VHIRLIETEANMTQYLVVTDGLTTRPRFSRRYAVVDTLSLGVDGLPHPVLQTDDGVRARDYAHELNAEAAAGR
jgi:hypothetical protein